MFARKRGRWGGGGIISALGPVGTQEVAHGTGVAILLARRDQGIDSVDLKPVGVLQHNCAKHPQTI